MEQTDPVAPSEFVLRRISNNLDFYKPGLDVPVTRVACSPFKRDEDGLSVYRELFVSPEEVAADGPNPNGYYVARLLVEDIQNLGLSVIANALEGELPGHSLIPELNYAAIRDPATKKEAKKYAWGLAKLASENIVLRPGTE